MKNFFFLILTLSLLSCQRTTNDNNNQNTDTTEEGVTLNEGNVEAPPETDKEKVARMQGATQKLEVPNPLSDMPTKLTSIAPHKLCQNKYGCLKETIHPVGWSEDGKFAYCVEYPEEAADMYRMDFFIQDLATGEMVNQASFKAETTMTFEKLWAGKKSYFVEDFDKHNIQSANSFELKSFPIRWEGSSISCSIDNQKQMNDYAGMNIVTESQLTINGKNLGSKQIAKQVYGKYDLVIDTEVIGYLKSPLEDRIVVFYGKEKRGFEGPPNVLNISLIGFDLANGWK